MLGLDLGRVGGGFCMLAERHDERSEEGVESSLTRVERRACLQ